MTVTLLAAAGVPPRRCSTRPAGLARPTGPVAVPGAITARTIFGALVVRAAEVKIVTSLVGPDFAAIEATETKATESVAPAASAGPDPKRSEAAKRGAEIARANRERKEQEKADAAERRRQARLTRGAERMAAGYVPADAPVSPAVA